MSRLLNVRFQTAEFLDCLEKARCFDNKSGTKPMRIYQVSFKNGIIPTRLPENRYFSSETQDLEALAIYYQTHLFEMIQKTKIPIPDPVSLDLRDKFVKLYNEISETLRPVSYYKEAVPKIMGIEPAALHWRVVTIAAPVNLWPLIDVSFGRILFAYISPHIEEIELDEMWKDINSVELPTKI